VIYITSSEAKDDPDSIATTVLFSFMGKIELKWLSGAE